MKVTIIETFFALLKAGLWEKQRKGTEKWALDIEEWKGVYRLAEEQSVVGLIAAGIDRFKTGCQSFQIPQNIALQFIGSALQIEQRNKAMNECLAKLVVKLRKEGVYTLLLKGQGVAQCYEKPYWRTCGDIDFLLNEDNYAKAKKVLRPMASSVENEYTHAKHLGMNIDGWVVELHGNLHCALSSRIISGLNEIQKETFYGGRVCSWMNGKTQIFLLGMENNIVYVFTHFLNHFYKGGVGLRQICDWCRLLWTFREELDRMALESRIKKMGLTSEWQAFGVYAVKYLGMPIEAMPMYSPDRKWQRKAKHINEFLLNVGNFGHNRGLGYYTKYPYILRKALSMKMRIEDLASHARTFPLDSFRFMPRIMFNGVSSAVRGK